MKPSRHPALRTLAFFCAASLVFSVFEAPASARTSKKKLRTPSISARSAIVLDARDGRMLYAKNPHLRLPPASTTKIMTALIVLERLPLDSRVPIGPTAVGTSPSKADLTLGADYAAGDLLAATLVASSNDAALALAEAVAGTEADFVKLMNAKAASLGMKETRFANASGLPQKGARQYTTAYDLAQMMRVAIRDRRIDRILGMPDIVIAGSDGKRIVLKNHNKMLWRSPGFVKGKTGWTQAARHTFVGTNFTPSKTITFAMLSSQQPWTDIRRLANFGILLQNLR